MLMNYLVFEIDGKADIIRYRIFDGIEIYRNLDRNIEKMVLRDVNSWKKNYIIFIYLEIIFLRKYSTLLVC